MLKLNYFLLMFNNLKLMLNILIWKQKIINLPINLIYDFNLWTKTIAIGIEP